MVFTTQIFIFVFFPICFAAYTVVGKMEQAGSFGRLLDKIRAKDIILVIFSLGFYMWSCFDDVFWLLFYSIAVYCGACLINKFCKKKSLIPTCREKNSFAAILFGLIIACCLAVLIYYKYSEFLLEIFNLDIVLKETILAPLGLSFIVFSTISYMTDIYRGEATSGSFVDCALYLSFFPKVVSGPIVLWKDFQKQIKTRKTTIETTVDGFNHIMIGFMKKVLLADTFGACLSKISLWGIDQITAIGILVLYMLQIYYDFSGYSDIAIGLSKLFGFHFSNNFNFPYRSKSISEFWRRWHISLGTWFRQYVYFPLGGSHASLGKTLRNLGIVFVLTGIWHGAGWNYILWGFINGIIVIFERIVAKNKLYQKIPDFVKYGCTMFVVLLFWQLFKYQDITEVYTLFGIILGKAEFDTIYYTWKYYYDSQIIVFTIIGVLGATLFGSPKILQLYNKGIETKLGYAVQELVLVSLFVLAIIFMVNSTYSPFIYFQY